MEPDRRLTDKERRGIERCRKALARGRRVRGRPLASGEHGLLVDLGGAAGHLPAGDAAPAPGRRGLWRSATSGWDGWVVAVDGDLVHLASRPPGEQPREDALRHAEVVGCGRSGALVRLRDEGGRAIVPWDEVSWQPSLARPALERGAQVAGRVVGLTIDGPILSPRAAVPSPWPAIALANAPGARVDVHLEAVGEVAALLRTQQAPRAAAVVSLERLPAGAAAGDVLRATVAEVHVVGGRLELADLSLRERSPRAPRPGPGAGTPAPPGPGPASSGSRS